MPSVNWEREREGELVERKEEQKEEDKIYRLRSWRLVREGSGRDRGREGKNDKRGRENSVRSGEGGKGRLKRERKPDQLFILQSQ